MMNGILPDLVIIFMIIQSDMDCVKILKIGSILVFIALSLKEFIQPIGVEEKEKKNLKELGMISLFRRVC